MSARFVCVVGARPNLIKAAPLLEELANRSIDCALVHTGQHYDQAMDRVFFDELRLPHPAAHLGVGSGSHGVQTAAALVGIEEWLVSHPVDGLLAVGDVNSTLAAALAAAKLRIPVIHVEAGYRSGDVGMPEEINRLVTDHISSLLFAPTDDAVDNLRREGIADDIIEQPGNLVAQAYLTHRSRALDQKPWTRFGLREEQFVVATIHRPESADSSEVLQKIISELEAVPYRVLWPVHPRTRAYFATTSLSNNIILTQPLPYLDMVGLVSRAACIITDSGGIQEEACLAGVPCVTVRKTTERVVTVKLGANRLCRPDAIATSVEESLESTRGWDAPARWDLGVASRMTNALSRLSGN